MNTVMVLDALRRHAVFNVGTLASLLGKERAYAKVYLHRLKERGLVFELQRNAFTLHEDPFLVASRIIWPSYISLWSALRHHDLTEQVPHVISVITTRRKSRKAIAFGNSKIVFVSVRPEHFFGFEKERIAEIEVFIADPEKALIDCVLLKRVSVSEVFEMMHENVQRLDTEKIVRYIRRARSKALAKRFGWMLERLGHDSHAELKYLTHRTRIPLDYALPAKGERDRKWGVIENMGGRA
ncbi:MAG: type IV toxin-antitoxin system AbiEi family antitoxin [Candidatus Thermoplasmatota archaeon]